jgi:hypothetical protein
MSIPSSRSSYDVSLAMSLSKLLIRDFSVDLYCKIHSFLIMCQPSIIMDVVE